MTADQFAMWLHGYLEISDPKEIGEKETQIIKDHLALLYKKETPDRTIKREKNELVAPMPLVGPNTPPYTTVPYVYCGKAVCDCGNCNMLTVIC